MKHGRTITAVAVALVIAGAATAGFLFLHHNRPIGGSAAASVASKLNSVPDEAKAVVRLLLSARGRAALTPELRAVLPHGNGRLFPAGSRFTPSTRSWHQAGAYANMTGLLREPGRAPVKAEIGLVNRHGKWLVTFEGAA
jgi:hypothetical protein